MSVLVTVTDSESGVGVEPTAAVPKASEAWSSETETDDELLKLLTIESGMVVDLAVQSVLKSVRELYLPLPFTDDELNMAVEAIVRLVLSHLVRPSKTPAEAADDIALLVSLALRGATTRING